MYKRQNKYTATPIAVVAVCVALGCQSDIKRSFTSENRIAITNVRELSDNYGFISGAVRLASGSVVVADEGRNQIRIFKVGSKAPTTLAHQGKQRGEFASLHQIQRCGDDTLVGYDDSASKLEIFTESDYIRQVSLPPKLLGANFVGCMGMDSLVFEKLPEQLPGFGQQLFTQTVFRFDAITGQLEWMTTLRGTEMFVSRVVKAFYPRPFGVHAILAVGKGGVYISESDSSLVLKLLEDGSRTSIFLPRIRSRRLTSSDRTQYEKEQVATAPDRKSAKNMKYLWDEADWGTRVPALDRLLVSTTGDLWVRQPPSSSDTSAAWMIAPYKSKKFASALLNSDWDPIFVDSSTILARRLSKSGQHQLIQIEYRMQQGKQ